VSAIITPTKKKLNRLLTVVPLPRAESLREAEEYQGSLSHALVERHQRLASNSGAENAGVVGSSPRNTNSPGGQMAAKYSRMTADSPAAMEQVITSYITQGFVVVNKTATSVTLSKRKEFSVLWAVIGFIVCILPLLIYLIVYATQSDQVVEIVLV
jgi:hypothetical protein